MSDDNDPTVSHETKLLHLYHALLLKWQNSINLISPNTVNEAWDRHFVDSLQLVPLIPASAKTLYDIGSGAGFPGFVLAMALQNLSVTLIESDSKKCAFLQTVSRETGQKIAIENVRVESAAKLLSAPDVITARALASLDNIFKLCRPWFKLNNALVLILPKGEHFAYEIEEAKRAGWSFDVAITPSKTERGAGILTVTKLVKKGE